MTNVNVKAMHCNKLTILCSLLDLYAIVKVSLAEWGTEFIDIYWVGITTR